MKAAILILPLILPLQGCAYRGWGYSPDSPFHGLRKAGDRIFEEDWGVVKWLDKVHGINRGSLDTFPWICEEYDSSGTCKKWEMKNPAPSHLK